ncbi:hypothetical protein GQ53DRAFT_169942 [Thozetella sp. PMI_491]|nr:hypothetical protein GQ53DRAFT_169942 [Thozetella sp. PMI_491]
MKASILNQPIVMALISCLNSEDIQTLREWPPEKIWEVAEEWMDQRCAQMNANAYSAIHGPNETFLYHPLVKAMASTLGSEERQTISNMQPPEIWSLVVKWINQQRAAMNKIISEDHNTIHEPQMSDQYTILSIDSSIREVLEYCPPLEQSRINRLPFEERKRIALNWIQQFIRLKNRGMLFSNTPDEAWFREALSSIKAWPLMNAINITPGILVNVYQAYSSIPIGISKLGHLRSWIALESITMTTIDVEILQLLEFRRWIKDKAI